MTNFEKIKQMSVEEMARAMCTTLYGCGLCLALGSCDIDDDLSCSETYEKWLESEVEEDG